MVNYDFDVLSSTTEILRYGGICRILCYCQIVYNIKAMLSIIHKKMNIYRLRKTFKVKIKEKIAKNFPQQNRQ